MVNENKGKVYEPTLVYNRKMSRDIIRHQVEQKNGIHNVNKTMSAAFKQLHNKNTQEEK